MRRDATRASDAKTGDDQGEIGWDFGETDAGWGETGEGGFCDRYRVFDGGDEGASRGGVEDVAGVCVARRFVAGCILQRENILQQQQRNESNDVQNDGTEKNF